ncbi:MAG: hypothetical protein ACLUAR_15740 [Pilosibacter sp.]
MGKWNRWGRTLAAVVLAAAVVCGCGVKETLLSGRKSEREYGKAETMVIVTTERLRYEELYTGQDLGYGGGRVWNYLRGDIAVPDP